MRLFQDGVLVRTPLRVLSTQGVESWVTPNLHLLSLLDLTLSAQGPDHTNPYLVKGRIDRVPRSRRGSGLHLWSRVQWPSRVSVEVFRTTDMNRNLINTRSVPQVETGRDGWGTTCLLSPVVREVTGRVVVFVVSRGGSFVSGSWMGRRHGVRPRMGSRGRWPDVQLDVSVYISDRLPSRTRYLRFEIVVLHEVSVRDPFPSLPLSFLFILFFLG